MKQCTTCKIEKNETDFYIRKESGVLLARCKVCVDKNRERDRLKRKKWVANNKERSNEIKHLYLLREKIKRKEKISNFIKENPEKVIFLLLLKRIAQKKGQQQRYRRYREKNRDEINKKATQKRREKGIWGRQKIFVHTKEKYNEARKLWDKGYSGSLISSMLEVPCTTIHFWNRDNNRKLMFRKEMPKSMKKKTTQRLKEWWKNPEYREKMIKRMTGENNPRWVKDRTKLKLKDIHQRTSLMYRDWRRKVFERDNYKCRIDNCDCSGRMEVHHILNWSEYPELRYKLNNGITLCHAHHPRGRAEEKRLIPELQGLVSVSSDLIWLY